MGRVQKGFTLIELMIVLVILAIVSSIAVTMFSGASEEAERSRIISEMSSLNDAMARYYQGNYSYAGATEEILRGSGGGAKIAESPAYDVVLDVDDDDQGYLIVATPKPDGDMASAVDATYSINHLGQRCVAAEPHDGCKTW